MTHDYDELMVKTMDSGCVVQLLLIRIMHSTAIGILFGVSCLFGQDSARVLTLQNCIDMAGNNNLNIMLSQNRIISTESNRRQAIYNFLPSLNANAGYTYFDGNNIDFTGQAVSNTSRSSQPSLSSNMVLFNAFANHHLLKRRKHEYEAAKYELKHTKILVEAGVIRTYLSVLVDSENIKVSDRRIDLLEQQLEREKKRVSVGVGSVDAVYNLQSQIADERLSNLNLRNQYQSDLLELLQAIQWEGDFDVNVAPLNTTDLRLLNEYDDYNKVLKEILNHSMLLKGAVENSEALRAEFKESKASRYPSLILDARHNRNYTSLLDVRYLDQFQDTPSNSVSIVLNIPIFNRYLIQNSIDVSKVAMLNAGIRKEQAVMEVTNAAQRDYLDLKAAQSAYQTALKNYEVLNKAFQFAKRRFESGSSDFYSYIESFNNLNRAEIRLINSKYIIVLRKQILNLYRGK